MFYKYEIKNNGREDILYLYLSMAYEFSKELINHSSNDDISRRTKNFIKSNKIDFRGDKVFLVVDDIIVKSVTINSSDDIEILNDKLYYSNDYYLVTVKLEDNSKIEITLKDYLRGVLATKMFFGIEFNTMCCLSIMYRTYAFSMMDKNKYIDANDNYALYKPISYYKLSWIDNYDELLLTIDSAISETDCLFLTYNHDYILPFMHFSNCGKTDMNTEYPYLSSVKSLWDLTSPFFIEYTDYSYDMISKLLNIKIDSHTNFNVIDINNGILKKVCIGDKTFTGEEIKKTLNLKSLNMVFILYNNYLRIITRGFGNFFGLSLYGSNELAKDGCSYISILKYYFPNVKINKYIKELS